MGLILKPIFNLDSGAPSLPPTWVITHSSPMSDDTHGIKCVCVCDIACKNIIHVHNNFLEWPNCFREKQFALWGFAYCWIDHVKKHKKQILATPKSSNYEALKSRGYIHHQSELCQVIGQNISCAWMTLTITD